MIGQVFGFLTVLRQSDRKSHYGKYWICGCWCGNYIEVRGTHLRTGNQNTCRHCYFDRKYPSEYMSWMSMHQRVKNPNIPKFQYWGGKGIKICARWAYFQYFLEDMGLKYDDKITLEREDSTKDYEPGNCIWASYTTQNNNLARPSRKV